MKHVAENFNVMGRQGKTISLQINVRTEMRTK